MTKQQAIQALNDQWAQGDIASDAYEQERAAIEYEFGEARPAQDERQGACA